MYFVYLLVHETTHNRYIGYTSDLERRIVEHNAGESKYTNRKSGNWSLVYYEAYASKEDAIEREKRLKQHGRAKQELYKRVERSLG